MYYVPLFKDDALVSGRIGKEIDVAVVIFEVDNNLVSKQK